MVRTISEVRPNSFCFLIEEVLSPHLLDKSRTHRPSALQNIIVFGALWPYLSTLKQRYGKSSYADLSIVITVTKEIMLGN